MVSEFEISPTINNIQVVKEETVVQNNITVEPIITILNVVKEETVIEYTITVNPVYEGLPGPRGLNNYELAQSNGFEGTYEEWELTQHGQDGKDLTLAEFNASEPVEILSNDAELFVKENGVFKRINKTSLIKTLGIAKRKSIEFITPILSLPIANTWYGWSQSTHLYANQNKSYGTGTLPVNTSTLYADSYAYYIKNAGILKKVTAYIRYGVSTEYLTLYMITANNYNVNRGEETEMQVIVNGDIWLRHNSIEEPPIIFAQTAMKEWDVDVEFSEHAIIQLFFKTTANNPAIQGMVINLEFE